VEFPRREEESGAGWVGLVVVVGLGLVSSSSVVLNPVELHLLKVVA
jgi:hypothetical protein